MFIGVARCLKEALTVPVLCTLSGEDIFLDELPEPHRREAFDLIRERGCDVDGFVATTEYFANHTASHFGLPREKVHVVRMGVHVEDFAAPADPPATPFTVGYLARICPAKGLAGCVRRWCDCGRPDATAASVPPDTLGPRIDPTSAESEPTLTNTS
jgi:glycosyltransferase involved in cell wall biosynthesis